MEGTINGSLNLIGYGLSAIGGGIGVGLVFAAYINGVARQPEAQRVLQPIAFLGLALTEALAILGLVFRSFLVLRTKRIQARVDRTGEI